MTKGSQYGHFLYVDASDESRQIAAADFKADLCTGMQVIFSANVADMTHADELPQVMFKLYGVNYDAEGNIQSQKLLHSFSSGDFKIIQKIVHVLRQHGIRFMVRLSSRKNLV